MVRSRRGKAGLKRLRTITGLSLGHLSRFERGKRSIRWEAVSALVSELDLDPAEVVAAARRLPPWIEDEIAVPGFAYALIEGDRVPQRTRMALRRFHIAAVVEARFPVGSLRGNVDPTALLASVGRRHDVLEEPEAPYVDIGSGTIKCGRGPDDVIRFQLAHALGHVVLETAVCNIRNENDEAEMDATAFAAFLLLPGVLLKREVTRTAHLGVWQEQSIGPLVDEVAVRLGAPPWLAARRIAEEGMLAQLGHLGER